MSVPFDVFGPGILWATRTDVPFATAPATPINIGYAQEFSIDFSANIKELTGQNQYPLDVARGITKMNWKAKSAVISGIAFNNVFFGSSFTTGSFGASVSEVHTVPGTPFMVTVTPPGGGTFEPASANSVGGGDLGVTYVSDTTTPGLAGLPMIKVPFGNTPTVGQYTCNPATGAYLFSTADNAAGAIVAISYRYTTTTGQTLTVNNQLLGFTPIVQLDYYTTRNLRPFLVRLPQATAAKLTMATKLEDFLMPEFDGGAFANASGIAVELGFPEVS